MSRDFTTGINAQACAETLDILDEEFASLKRTVSTITPRQWTLPTRLRVDATCHQDCHSRRAVVCNRPPLGATWTVC
jgi:hypothetical protein